MEKIIITFDIADKSKHLVVSDSVTWKGLCKSATLFNGKKKKKVGAKNMEMAPGINTIELELDATDTICDCLFKGTEITSCVIPEGVKSIGSEVFENCSLLKTVNLPSSLEEIGYHTFEGCTAVEKIIIPVSVKNADRALVNFDIDKIEFAPGRTELPIGIYSGVEDITKEVNIPEGITSIKRIDGRSANFEFIDVKGFAFPSSLAEIETCAIENTVLGHIEWPEGALVTDQDIEVTGDGFCKTGFFNLPETPDTIILTYNYNTDTLIIPANVKEIRVEDTLDCLRYIYVDPANTVYDSRENCNAIIETATGKMIVAGELTTVPEGVTEILPTARGINKSVKCPTLPSSLKQIKCSFSDFKEITLTPLLEKSLGDLSQFSGKLTISSEYKELPDCEETGIDYWGNTKLNQFFSGCSFSSIVFSEKLERIGAHYFEGNHIHGVLHLPSSLKTIGKNAFKNSSSCWKKASDNAEEAKEFTSVIIPDSVTTIEDGAFANWMPANVVLPNHLEVLNDIFAPTKENGSKHSIMKIPASVKEINLSYGNGSFMQVDAVYCYAPVAPVFKKEPNHLTNGTIFYPKGADYSSWEPLFKGWKFKEIED